MMNLTEWINSYEEWIQNQIALYAEEFVSGHDLYFDPNDWIPIPEVSKAVIALIENPGPPHRELPQDDDFLESDPSPSGEFSDDQHAPKASFDPVAPLVKTYTQRSLQEGTPPALFLSMLKCYRRSYIKLIHSANFEKSFTGYCHRRIADFFDRFEILSSIIWVKADPCDLQPLPEDSTPAPAVSVPIEAPLETPADSVTLTASTPPAVSTGSGLKTRIIDQLVEGITYEINQPMQSIIDNTSVLQKDFAVVSQILQSYHDLLTALKTGEATPDTVLAVEQETRQLELESMMEAIPGLFRQLSEGVERTTKIVGAMKEFWRTRIDEDINININRVLENVLIITRNKWKFVAEINSELDPDLPVVLGLPGEFNQVILNLMIQSIHSIAESINSGSMGKGLIKITTSITADGIEIRIRNNGKPIWEVGTDPEILNLMEMADEYEQEILNRWLVSQEVIMKKYGGSLELEADGRETVMIIRLPLKTEG